MIVPTIDKILAVLKKKNYPFHEDDTKDFNLNLVGIRRNTNVPNSFDDLFCVFWKYKSNWTLRVFPCTTDPGTYWLKNSGNPNGTAIVKEGHYPKLWHIGLHQGKYKALKQCNPITVYRDKDKDNELDTVAGTEQTGIFGINCHRANENGQSVQVDKWSAGCLVVQNRNVLHPDFQSTKIYEFEYFLMLCDKKVINWGEFFDYALINESDFV